MMKCGKAVLPVCGFLFFLALGMSTGLAQSTPNAAPASQPPAANAPSAPTNTQSAPAHPTPSAAEARKQFRQVLKELENKGRPTTLRVNLLQDLGFYTSEQQSIPATVLNGDEDPETHDIYLLDQPGDKTVLLTIKDGDQLLVYVSNGAGVLRKAAKLMQGRRMNSQSLQQIPLEVALDGFIVEKDYWIERLAAGKLTSHGKQ